MSFKVFDVPTMIAVSGPWVDDGKDKPVLMSLPLTAGLVPYLVSTHNTLLQLRVNPSETEAESRALTEQAAAVDATHDENYRSLYFLLSAWGIVADSDRRDTIEKIRDDLMPEGLAGTQRTYLAESGAVELAASKVTPEVETTLKSVVVDGKNAFQLFEEWVASGRALGDIERKRARLAEKSASNAVTPKDIQTARNNWIRAANLLSDMLTFDEGISEEIVIRLLQPLRAAEAKFAKKKSRLEVVADDELVEETDEIDVAPAEVSAEA